MRKRREQTIQLGDVVDDLSTPEPVVRDGIQIKSGYNAKVTTSSAERPVKIRIALLIDFQDLTSRIYNLVVANGVTTQSKTRMKEAESTAEKQPSDANIVDAASKDGNVERIQFVVNCSPTVTGPYADSVREYLVRGDLSQPLQVDGDAVPDVGGSSKESVGAALDSKRAVKTTSRLDNGGDVLSRCWRGEAGWI